MEKENYELPGSDVKILRQGVNYGLDGAGGKYIEEVRSRKISQGAQN